MLPWVVMRVVALFLWLAVHATGTSTSIYLAATGPNGSGTVSSPFTSVASAQSALNQSLYQGENVTLFISPGSVLD